MNCANCGRPIVWDDWCYVHHDSGFADCKVVAIGGVPVIADDRTTMAETKTSKKLRIKMATGTEGSEVEG